CADYARLAVGLHVEQDEVRFNPRNFSARCCGDGLPGGCLVTALKRSLSGFPAGGNREAGKRGLGSRNERSRHAQLADPESDQQWERCRLSGNASADAEWPTCGRSAFDDLAQQADERRMKRRMQRAERGIPAVRGEEVLG